MPRVEDAHGTGVAWMRSLVEIRLLSNDLVTITSVIGHHLSRRLFGSLAQLFLRWRLL